MSNRYLPISKCNKMRRALALSVIATLQLDAQALPIVQTYTTDLSFSTTGIGMWGSGPAQFMQGSTSVGFSKSGSLGPFSPIGLGISGGVGANLAVDWMATTGSINVGYGARVQALVPTNARIGSTVTFGSTYNVTQGLMQTYSPQVSAEVVANVNGKADVRAVGRTLWSPSFDRTFTLLEFDTASGSRTWDFKYGSLQLDAPTVNTTGSLGANGTIRSSGQDNFLAANVDLDSIITALTGVPFGYRESLDYGILKAQVDVSLLDLDLSLLMGVQQEFEFQSRLMASYAFEDGSTMVRPAGESFSLSIPEGNWGEDYDVYTTYSLAGELRNNTDITLDVVFDLDMFEADASLLTRWPRCTFTWRRGLRCSLEWKEIADAHLGPLVDGSWHVLDGSIGVFDKTFDVPFETISAHYAIPLAVPEPSPLALSGLGLVILGALRRRENGHAYDNRLARPRDLLRLHHVCSARFA